MPDISGIGILTAFLAGAISFLSPCVLPFVPGYVSYIAGRSVTGGPGGNAAALRLYARNGWTVNHEGPHPVYARANIGMEKYL